MTGPARTWFDGPAGGTPINAARLNGMEADIASIRDRVLNVLDAPFNATPSPISTGTAAGGQSGAIQAAIDAAAANYAAGLGPTTVYLPPGMYTMSTTAKTVSLSRLDISGNFFTVTSTACLILPAGVSLQGAGQGKTILRRFTTGPSAIIETVDYSYGTISDMSIIGGGVTTNTHGIFMSVSSTAPATNKDIWYRNLEIGQVGLYAIGHQYGGPDNLHYEDLWIHDTGDDGIDHKVRQSTIDVNNNGAKGAFFNNVLVERHGGNFVDASGLDLRGKCTLSNIEVKDFGRAGVRTFGITLSAGIANVNDKRAASARTTMTNFYIEGKPDMDCSGLQMNSGGPQNISNGYVRWCTTNGVWARDSLGGGVQKWRNGPTISNMIVEGSRDGAPYRVEMPRTTLIGAKTIADIETFNSDRGNLTAGQTVFVLRQPMSTVTGTRLVVKNDVTLTPGTQWTLSGQTITLASAVAGTDVLEVINSTVQGCTIAATDVVLVGESHDPWSAPLSASATPLGRLTQAGNQMTKSVLTYSRTGETAAASQMRVILTNLGLVTDNTVP